ncbi:MAG: hypothetical protein HOC91_05070 [Nitrospinaceae bacterium]|jgi:uncharacterized membrane protein YphA (DoxX/SURF4 family)|nr:hypothetical protein [Nitrospinaceae bacterium]MBT3823322.1 hypothetical protein [Nitrospinaceae bacterium]MBT4094728.1 hypothetical protein [Nitrospinaceae bacterium]MBT4429866.1 hypothetical protein [Nitrospinaceae bacterium]MBT5946306.1 hypothetical protein [Nitrospinaceae bacterium]
MGSTAKDWGVTLLRLWTGYLIASTGYQMVEDGMSLSTLLALKSAPYETWGRLAVTAILTIGGAAMFLGIAIRIAATLTAIATAYFLWEHAGPKILPIINYQPHATIVVLSLIITLLGPGLLNLGSLMKKTK